MSEAIVAAIAEHKRRKRELIKEFNDHCRNAPPNHTAFCCQWCTDNGDAQIALDNLIEDLAKQLEQKQVLPS
jgi:hypothetical protein